MKYELVIVWETGKTEVFEYNTEEEAYNAGIGMKVALGNQISWYGVRRKRA